MSHKAITPALAALLKRLDKPTAFENATFEPKAGKLYLRESMLPAQTLGIGLEAGSTRDFKGIYQVLVLAPRDDYKAKGYTAADEVAEHFPRGMMLSKDGITVLIEQTTIGAGFVTGDRWAIPVSMNYRTLAK